MTLVTGVDAIGKKRSKVGAVAASVLPLTVRNMIEMFLTEPTPESLPNKVVASVFEALGLNTAHYEPDRFTAATKRFNQARKAFADARGEDRRRVVEANPFLRHRSAIEYAASRVRALDRQIEKAEETGGDTERFIQQREEHVARLLDLMRN